MAPVPPGWDHRSRYNLEPGAAGGPSEYSEDDAPAPCPSKRPRLDSPKERTNLFPFPYDKFYTAEDVRQLYDQWAMYFFTVTRTREGPHRTLMLAYRTVLAKKVKRGIEDYLRVRRGEFMNMSPLSCLAKLTDFMGWFSIVNTTKDTEVFVPTNLTEYLVLPHGQQRVVAFRHIFLNRNSELRVIDHRPQAGRKEYRIAMTEDNLRFRSFNQTTFGVELSCGSLNVILRIVWWGPEVCSPARDIEPLPWPTLLQTPPSAVFQEDFSASVHVHRQIRFHRLLPYLNMLVETKSHGVHLHLANAEEAEFIRRNASQGLSRFANLPREGWNPSTTFTHFFQGLQVVNRTRGTVVIVRDLRSFMAFEYDTVVHLEPLEVPWLNAVMVRTAGGNSHLVDFEDFRAEPVGDHLVVTIKVPFEPRTVVLHVYWMGPFHEPYGRNQRPWHEFIYLPPRAAAPGTYSLSKLPAITVDVPYQQEEPQ